MSTMDMTVGIKDAEEIKIRFHEDFVTEQGAVLKGVEANYWTAGKLNKAKDNVVWVCHAFTANANVAEWWPGLVGPGKLLDPANYYLICVNILGSCYGTTGPMSINPETGKPYGHDFPAITIRDIVKLNDWVRRELKIEKVKLLMGGSMGGQQVLEWAVQCPEVFENLFGIATNGAHSPWGVAFNETQRMCITADNTWGTGNLNAGTEGMKAARAVALLSYRNYNAYRIRQTEDNHDKYDHFKAASYQSYQGEKLARRFNAYSYWTLSKAMDTHNLARGRGRLRDVLNSIKNRTLLIGIESDHLFPLQEQQYLATYMPNCEYWEIDSAYGHDGFLLEYQEITEKIKAFLG